MASEYKGMNELSVEEKDEYVLHNCLASIEDANEILQKLSKEDNGKYQTVIEKLKDCHNLLSILMGVK